MIFSRPSNGIALGKLKQAQVMSSKVYSIYSPDPCVVQDYENKKVKLFPKDMDLNDLLFLKEGLQVP